MTERTDLDRMLAALAAAERRGHITVTHHDRVRVAQDMLVGVGLDPADNDRSGGVR